MNIYKQGPVARKYHFLTFYIVILSCSMKSVTRSLKKVCLFCSETNTLSEKKDKQPVYSDEEILNMADVVLTNSDGFIDYAKFKQTENK